MNKTIQKYFFIMLAAVLLPSIALAQNTVTFTNAAATGRYGPTQAQVNTAYDGTILDDAVTINTQGIQEWTVPATGTYTIEAWGAMGGVGNGSAAGLGARMRSDFTLTQGTVLKILVGQQPAATGSKGYGSGGGGGTFVVTGTSTAKIIAGGGGGGSYSNYNYDGGHGLTGTSGGDGITGYAGGTNGSGGGGSSGNWGGTGGAGLTGNG
ncbi:uncharacterized protein METZ01_LOCUS76528, partial [marine metagenome]